VGFFTSLILFSRIRHLFAIILTNCVVSNPKELWDKHKEDLSEDILHRLHQQNPDLELHYTQEIFNQALCLLEDLTLAMTGKLLKFCGMPEPQRMEGNNQLCREMLRETSYDEKLLAEHVRVSEPRLMADQRVAYFTILEAVAREQGGIFFLDAPGGTGKTFIINLLLAKVRLQKKIALAVASSGIAATLLQGGRTAHSAFKLPLDLAHNESPVCGISKGTGLAKVLQESSIIIWDECTMSHKRALEALNRTMQDLQRNKRIMGGVVVVLAGDFRQTLPVIPRSTPADELNACLKASSLWRFVKTLTLRTNMRAQLTGDPSSPQFSAQLLLVGDGKAPTEQDGLVRFPSNFCTVVPSIQQLAAKVFPRLQQNFNNPQWLCERAILAPKNDSVAKINSEIQSLLPGDVRVYKSLDKVLDESQAVNYPMEFLNSLEPAGIPPHNLHLKLGAPIMLLRNLDPPRFVLFFKGFYLAFLHQIKLNLFSLL